MKREEEIILSFYYNNPYNDPKKITDDMCTLMMDLYQFLLILFEVFRTKQYVVYVADGKVDIRCLPDCEQEYNKMISVRSPELTEAKVLEIDLDKEHRFLKTGKKYEEIKNVKEMNRLYFSTVLTNMINSNQFLYSRNSFLYFRLFGEASDYNVAYSLAATGICLTETFVRKGAEAAGKIIDNINQDFDKMQEVFDEKEFIIDDLFKRIDFFGEDAYKDQDMINIQLIYENRLTKMKYRERNKDIIGFISHGLTGDRKWLYGWIQYIVDLVRCLNVSGKDEIKWKTCMNINDAREAQKNEIFKKLRENLQELEKKNSDKFNWDNWQRQSIFYTYEIFQGFYGSED